MDFRGKTLYSFGKSSVILGMNARVGGFAGLTRFGMVEGLVSGFVLSPVSKSRPGAPGMRGERVSWRCGV